MITEGDGGRNKGRTIAAQSNKSGVWNASASIMISTPHASLYTTCTPRYLHLQVLVPDFRFCILLFAFFFVVGRLSEDSSSHVPLNGIANCNHRSGGV